ncbi:hypothetical protein AMTR_s00040p00196200 [Amborella trichopoda]|uniref:Uncharacterized protein n=1 Tax=Amborella trichopoda TaxID=13333 RepID=W1PT13_AMBTC|nr:hypothetical protein AMTR_s00040p00196200 [Amborella trichopoda]
MAMVLGGLSITPSPISTAKFGITNNNSSSLTLNPRPSSNFNQSSSSLAAPSIFQPLETSATSSLPATFRRDASAPSPTTFGPPETVTTPSFPANFRLASPAQSTSPAFFRHRTPPPYHYRPYSSYSNPAGPQSPPFSGGPNPTHQLFHPFSDGSTSHIGSSYGHIPATRICNIRTFPVNRLGCQRSSRMISDGEGEAGAGRWTAEIGKLRAAFLPFMAMAATSYAVAAISGVAKDPSHIRFVVLGFLISDTHIPVFLFLTPRWME